MSTKPSTKKSETVIPEKGKFVFGFITIKGLGRKLSNLITADSMLQTTRQGLKKVIGTAYAQMMALTKSTSERVHFTIADFARQFDKDVPTDRAEYREHSTYRAIERMLQSMPDVKRYNKDGSPETKQQQTARKKASANSRTIREERRTKFQVVLMSLADQVGIPVPLLKQACTACQVTDKEWEALNAIDAGRWQDLGLGAYELVRSSDGKPACKINQRQLEKEQEAHASMPSTPTKTKKKAAKKAAKAKAKTGGKNVTESAYLGKGAYKRPDKGTTLRRGDNLSTPPPSTPAA